MLNKKNAAIVALLLSTNSVSAHQYSCGVSIAPGMNFGAYHHSKDSFATGSFSITCKKRTGELEPTPIGGAQPLEPATTGRETPIRVCADTGRYALGSYATRRMQRAGFVAGIPIANQRTEYNLFTNISHTQVWGNGSQGSSCIIVAPRDQKQFFAKMPQGQKAAYPGRYDDRVTVWFTY